MSMFRLKAKYGIARPPVEYDARKLVALHGTHKPMRVVLHDTESHDHAGILDIKGIFQFWRRQGMGLGAHLVIDKHGNTGLGASAIDKCWHVAGHNTGSIGIEQIGFARFSRVGWLRRRKQLKKVAWWLAWYSLRWDIPLVRSTEHGVCMHRDLNKGEHSYHSDPGPGYPIGRVLRMARRIKKRGRP